MKHLTNDVYQSSCTLHHHKKVLEQISFPRGSVYFDVSLLNHSLDHWELHSTCGSWGKNVYFSQVQDYSCKMDSDNAGDYYQNHINEGDLIKDTKE